MSCQKDYNSEVCQDLSMRAFKGVPQAAHDFQNNCEEIEIEFTHEDCQKALNDLIVSGSLKAVTNKYGEISHECFSQNDLKTFNRDDREWKIRDFQKSKQ